MDGEQNRERVLEVYERWDRTGRLEAVRERLFGVAVAGVLAAVLLSLVPDAGALTPAVVGLVRVAGLGLAVAAYSVRTALENPDRLREADFENELVVALGTSALGGLYGATRESAPAVLAWRLLFRESPRERSEYGTDPTTGSGGRVDEAAVAAWRSRLGAGAVALLAVVVVEQLTAGIGVDRLVELLAGAGGGSAPGHPGLDGPAVPEFSPGATVALLVGAVVVGGLIGLLLAVSRG
jgi:hypothetical protein